MKLVNDILMLSGYPQKHLILTLSVLFFTAAIFGFSATVAAQDDTQCSAPKFQITSSKDVTALLGEPFTYFVVADGTSDYQLTSQLPADLSYSDGRISGTPQQAGEYPLQFTATNECGSTTQTVMLTVVNGDQLANAGTEANQNQNVQLDEVPETGFSADQALTISFYLLALLLVSMLAARRLYHPSPGSVSNSSNRLPDGGRAQPRRQKGSGNHR